MCYAKESMASKPPPIASSLNPNAPAFVPAAFQAAEDFSPEWYELIQTNTSFREWWMKERHESDEAEPATAVPARRENTELDDIEELLELGFQSGILDDLEDLPSPVAVPQQQQQQQQQQHQQHQLHHQQYQQHQHHQHHQQHQQHQHQLHQPYQQRYGYYQQQQQQQPQQHYHAQQNGQPQQQYRAQQNEQVNLLMPTSYRSQKFRSVDGAGGAEFYRGTVLREGKPQ